jgi:hypothetical protein
MAEKKKKTGSTQTASQEELAASSSIAPTKAGSAGADAPSKASTVQATEAATATPATEATPATTETAKRKPTPEEQEVINQLAAVIAERLGEEKDTAIDQIRRIIRWLGAKRTQEYVEESFRVEENGGMMLPDESRRRTLGGVFFHLVKHNATPRERLQIWPELRIKGNEHKTRKERATIIELLRASAQQDVPGDATTVKMTILGRPGKVVERPTYVTVMMRPMKTPTLPKGLPTPPSPPSGVYAVLISGKQWRKVAESIKDPEDILIVEGFGIVSPHLPGTVEIYATNTTTKKLQQALRVAQREQMAQQQAGQATQAAQSQES